MDTQTTPNKPVMTLRDGRIKASVWLNQGKDGPYHSVSLSRTYKDRDGNLKDTTSFSGGELLKVAELAREAHGVLRNMNRTREKDVQHERNAYDPQR